MQVSVIIPVYNGGNLLRRCLSALQKTHYEMWECIVVDDGSTDDSVEIAQQFEVKVVCGLRAIKGPAHARNVGAQLAQGELLFFIDADVLVQPGTISHAVATMLAEPELAACFGSYDESPCETNFISQYRNLLHHYVHQSSKAEASTFWSGCGIIRRDVFLEMGGFDTTKYTRPSIEDIDLGYRLCEAGHQIRLEKLLLVRHMKRWAPRNMIVTDIRDRALPWTRLIVQGGGLPNDLNLQTTQRWSTAVSFLFAAILLFTPLQPRLLFLLLPAIGLLIQFNRDFYTFLAQKRGVWFAIKAMPWHWLYFLYSGLSFIVGVVGYGLLKWDSKAGEEIRPLISSLASPNQPAPPQHPSA